MHDGANIIFNQGIKVKCPTIESSYFVFYCFVFLYLVDQNGGTGRYKLILDTCRCMGSDGLSQFED